uniref:Uncharacterized protein n=1 Tax=Denticeps clupeoides TaxID=299321 RepID=A0AAY4EIS7_9TELE
MLNSYAAPMRSAYSFLEGQVAFSHTRWSNNRSVMPLDIWGCTRATMGGSVRVYPASRGAGNPLNPTLSTPRGDMSLSAKRVSTPQHRPPYDDDLRPYWYKGSNKKWRDITKCHTGWHRGRVNNVLWADLRRPDCCPLKLGLHKT